MANFTGTTRDLESRPLASRWLAVIAAALALAACGGGGGGSGGGEDYDPPPTTLYPTLASIQSKIFTPICTECHAGSTAPQGLRLEAGMSYGMLVNVASNEVPSLDRVEPGDPDNSYIIRKLEGTASVGARMPFGGPYLDQADINVIRQWITDGAAETAVAASSKPATMKAGWPVQDAELDSIPGKVVLISDQELDTTRLHGGSVFLVQTSKNGQVLDSLPVMDVQMRVTSQSPTVITLALPDTLSAGQYEVRMAGAGPMAVVGRNGLALDGDGDGLPGGDFVLAFEIRK